MNSSPNEQAKYQFSAFPPSPIYEMDDFQWNISSSYDREEIIQSLDNVDIQNEMNFQNQNMNFDSQNASQNEILSEESPLLNRKRLNSENPVNNQSIGSNLSEHSKKILNSMQNELNSFLNLDRTKYVYSENKMNNKEGGQKRKDKLNKKQKERTKNNEKEAVIKNDNKYQNKAEKAKGEEKNNQIQKNIVSEIKIFGKEKEKKPSNQVNNQNDIQLESHQKMSDSSNINEYEEPKEPIGNFSSMNIEATPEKSQNTQSSSRMNSSSFKSEKVNYLKSQMEGQNATCENNKPNLPASKNFNASLNSEVSSLSFIVGSSESSVPFQSYLSESTHKSVILSQDDSEIIKEEDNKGNLPDFQNSLPNLAINPEESENEVSNISEQTQCPSGPKISRKSILSHLKEQIFLHLEFEKASNNRSGNSKYAPFRKYLIQDFLNITPAFWNIITNDKRFPFSKANYYIISQYLKYYIWMRSILEIQKNNLDNNEINIFKGTIPPQLFPIILQEEEFINRLMNGAAEKSFNQFIINIDLVFALPIKLEEFFKLKAIEQKKFLSKKFKEEGIDKFRKSITKNNFLNKVYLSVMNEFIIRSIYPEAHPKLIAEEEARLPIEMLIGRKIIGPILI